MSAVCISSDRKCVDSGSETNLWQLARTLTGESGADACRAGASLASRGNRWRLVAERHTTSYTRTGMSTTGVRASRTPL
jgi:hypothetical protein